MAVREDAADHGRILLTDQTVPNLLNHGQREPSSQTQVDTEVQVGNTQQQAEDLHTEPPVTSKNENEGLMSERTRQNHLLLVCFQIRAPQRPTRLFNYDNNFTKQFGFGRD